VSSTTPRLGLVQAPARVTATAASISASSHAFRMGLPSERLFCCRAPRRAAAAGGRSPGLNRSGTAHLLAFPDCWGRFEAAPQAGEAWQALAPPSGRPPSALSGLSLLGAAGAVKLATHARGR
jgi:hypothetical protein